MTIVLPQARAGAIFQTIIRIGKLQSKRWIRSWWDREIWQKAFFLLAAKSSLQILLLFKPWLYSKQEEALHKHLLLDLQWWCLCSTCDHNGITQYLGEHFKAYFQGTIWPTTPIGSLTVYANVPGDPRAFFPPVVSIVWPVILSHHPAKYLRQARNCMSMKWTLCCEEMPQWCVHSKNNSCSGIETQIYLSLSINLKFNAWKLTGETYFFCFTKQLISYAFIWSDLLQ